MIGNGIVGNQYLQILFLLQSIHGWYNWDSQTTNITWLSNYNRFNFSIAFSIILIILLSFNLSFFDSITSSLSVVGILLLSYKKIDTWTYWLIADLLYVWFFIDEGLYLSAVLYFIFFVLAIVGLIEWKKIIKDELKAKQLIKFAQNTKAAEIKANKSKEELDKLLLRLAEIRKQIEEFKKHPSNREGDALLESIKNRTN